MPSCERFRFHLPLSARMCGRIGIALLLLGVGVCVACAETPAPPNRPFLIAAAPRVPVFTLMKGGFMQPSSSAAIFFSMPSSIRPGAPAEYGFTPPHARGAWRVANWFAQETLGSDGMRAAKQGISRAKHFGLKK